MLTEKQEQYAEPVDLWLSEEYLEASEWEKVGAWLGVPAEDAVLVIMDTNPEEYESAVEELTAYSQALGHVEDDQRGWAMYQYQHHSGFRWAITVDTHMGGADTLWIAAANLPK